MKLWPNIIIACLLSAAHINGVSAKTLTPSPQSGPPQPAYADLIDLADSAPLVLRAQIRKATPLEPARAVGIRPGWARLYLEVKAQALLFGSDPLGEAQQVLADVKLDAKGKVPNLGKAVVLLFARPVPGRSGALQLLIPDGWLIWNAGLETRVRAALAEVNAPDAPPRITGVQEARYIPGSLTGEGETQVFLAATEGAPASLSISRKPNQPPRVTASFSELVETSGTVPRRETLAWYRMACFLPAALPSASNMSASPADKLQAEQDYKLAIESLGACWRQRR